MWCSSCIPGAERIVFPILLSREAYNFVTQSTKTLSTYVTLKIHEEIVVNYTTMLNRNETEANYYGDS